jgi:uncharacterized protein YkwD
MAMPRTCPDPRLPPAAGLPGAAVLLLALACVARPVAAGAPGALSAAHAVRTAGCGGHPGIRQPLRGNALLDDAAVRWASGSALSSAIEHSGYRADQTAALHLRGAAPLAGALGRSLCAALLDPANRDLGSAQLGNETWLIIAAPFARPDADGAPDVAGRVLRLVNAARATARLCGRRPQPAVPALRLDAALSAAALEHAQDMLRYRYFDHQGHDGSTPGTRVAARGYRYRLVGENIAEGPQTPQEVVQGWLDSPGHCQNLMEARFTDMGIAFAVNSGGPPRIEWVQDLAARP